VIRAEVTVRGMVQGVFFRVEARDRARSLGLSGWVTNASDGTVRAAFEGDEERVRSMIEWCGRGPGGARVEAVDVEWTQAEGEQGFTIR
jgi:acylphosphatase